MNPPAAPFRNWNIADYSFPYQLRGLETSASMADLGLQREQLGLQRGQFDLRMDQAMSPYQLRQAGANLEASQLGLQRGQFELGQAQALAPYERGQAQTGLATSRFNLGQAQAMAPYQIGQARLGLERGQFELGQERQMAPYQLRSQMASTGMGELGLQRGQFEFDEYKQGAGLRGMERKLGEAQTSINLAKIGDVGQAGQRAYTFGREAEELERLRMANEGRRLQSQMSFLPQMEALRGGIASRMASNLGVSLPSGGNRPYSSGTGYRPSWMQSYQTPRFPR